MQKMKRKEKEGKLNKRKIETEGRKGKKGSIYKKEERGRK